MKENKIKIQIYKEEEILNLIFFLYINITRKKNNLNELNNCFPNSSFDYFVTRELKSKTSNFLKFDEKIYEKEKKKVSNINFYLN